MKNEARRLAALTAICNTFLPSIARPDDPDGYWARSAADLDVPGRIIALMAQAKAEDRVPFFQLLDLLASPLLGLTWLGPLRPAHRLSAEQRATLLHRWAASPLADLRNGFNGLRKLTSLFYFGDVAQGETQNPNWTTIGYQSLAEHIRPDPAPLPTLDVTENKTLYCDVLVIGSGAGGSIVAAQLAAAGQQVLVIEKGGYAPQHEFNQQEAPMLTRHFEAGGLLASQNGSITVLAGSTLGGGTTINWAAALRTPDYVLEEWATRHGNPHFLEKAYQQGFDYVEKRNGISRDFKHNPQNQALLDGAQALGYRAENIPMNLRFPADLSPDLAWQASGYSCYGDAFGIKQGAVQTFLRDAVQQGATLLPNTDVHKITIEKGVATGAEAQVRRPDGTSITLTIRAKRVVVSAGSLHTPVLLLKSGVAHPQLGRNLFLHPVVTVPAFYARTMQPWHGPMMSAIVQEFTRLDDNWGFRLECPPIHPGLGAFALSWESGEQLKSDVAQLRHLAVHVCLVRDRFGGRVTVGKQSGQPVIDYDLHDYDRRHLVRAMQESVRLHAAAGAEEVRILHNQPLHFLPKKDDLAGFIPQIAAKNWGLNRFGLFSAHQMGTCRMGGNADYPVQPNGEVRGVRNLFVADGSLFPAASGANPMLSIQALAYYVAQEIATRI